MNHQKSKTMKHEYGKGQQVKTCQRLWKALVVACQTAKPRCPCEATLNDPTSGQEHKAAFGLWQLDHFQAHPMGFGHLRWLIARIPLIDERQLHAASSRFLDGLGQFADLSPILFICWGDMQRQQISQRVDCCMHFTAFASFGPVVARSLPAFWARLQRATVKNRGRRLLISSCCQPEHGSQIVDDGFKNACLKPALCLLVDSGPWWQIMRHHAPLRSCSHDPTQSIEDFPQVVLALGSVLGHQGQIWGDKGPLFISDITGVCFSVHPHSLPKDSQKWEREQAVMSDFLSLSRSSSKVHNSL